MNTLLRLPFAADPCASSDAPSRFVQAWPSKHYLGNPVQFAVEQLGRVPTNAQAEVLEAIISNPRVVVRAGRRTGKSSTIAMLALYYFASYPECSVYISGPSYHQVDDITYHDILGILGDQRCAQCRFTHPERVGRPCPHVTSLDAKIHKSIGDGIESLDGRRRIFGGVPMNAEAARGIAGPADGFLILIDELSGIDPDIAHALETNARASGGSFAGFGNPSRLNDLQYTLHHSTGWKSLKMSALDVPNVKLGKTIVSGLADAQWVADTKEAYGADDPRWRVEIEGEFPLRSQLELISDAKLSKAFARHEAIVANDPTFSTVSGELWLGIDPATGAGYDESVIYARRGSVILECIAFQGGADAIVARVPELLTRYRRTPEEFVQINFDNSSTIGKELQLALSAHALRDAHARFNPLSSRGDIQRNSPMYGSGYARPRDAFFGNLALRLAKSLAVPFDNDLRSELLLQDWQITEANFRRLPDKKVLRRRLGRSPDRADALAYCCYEGRLEAQAELVEQARQARREQAASTVPRPTDLRSEYRRQHDLVFGRAYGIDRNRNRLIGS